MCPLHYKCWALIFFVGRKPLSSMKMLPPLTRGVKLTDEGARVSSCVLHALSSQRHSHHLRFLVLQMEAPDINEVIDFVLSSRSLALLRYCISALQRLTTTACEETIPPLLTIIYQLIYEIMNMRNLLWH
jgi:hypothetical protein